MAYWIMKTEPESYSHQQLVSDGRTAWDGVSNPVAESNLREMKPGDSVMIYHTGKEKACIGLAEVINGARLDPNDSTGRAIVVDIRAGKPLKRPVTLAEVRLQPELADLALVRMPRLSVMPATEKQWQKIISMSETRAV